MDPRIWHENHLRKDNYGPLGIFKFDESAIWGKGGYSSLLGTSNTEEYINALFFYDHQKNRLIDSYTSSVRVDFVTYNGHYNLFSYCYADFVINPSGVVEPEL